MSPDQELVKRVSLEMQRVKSGGTVDPYLDLHVRELANKIVFRDTCAWIFKFLTVATSTPHAYQSSRNEGPKGKVWGE